MAQSNNYMHAGLAKRLAEAADDFRDGLFHYFVCKSTFPYDLHCTAGYESATEAEEAGEALKIDLNNNEDGVYQRFGPFKTENTDNEPEVNYDSIIVKFMQDGNEIYCESYPSNTDVIVLSLSAYDKFLQPYYVKLYGIDIAKEMRKNATNVFASPTNSVSHRGSGPKAYKGKGGTHIKIEQFKD